jgi:multiple sugar transport system permease protein
MSATAQGPVGAAVLASPPVRRRRSRTGAATGLRLAGFYAVASALALLFLAPVLWSAITSFKPPAEASASPPTFLPESLSLGNYTKLTEYGEGIGVYLYNSFAVAGMTVIGTVVLSVLAGYGFSRYAFPFKGLAFGLVLAILMVPYPTILIPLYTVLGWVGLQNTLVGLAIVFVMFQLPFGIYMMRNAFETIPRELEEAAVIDGASTLGALRHVSLRLVLPSVITVALFAFLAAWNEFLAPLIFLNDDERYTLPVMLTSVQNGQLGAVDFGALQAGVTLAMLPPVILFLALQRYYVSGLIAGSVKA